MPAKRSTSWEQLPRKELLDLPIRELNLQIQGSPVEQHLERLAAELEQRGFRFRPYAWLSTAWFTPDATTGFAIPFYLAHPRLIRLERHMMLQVEGAAKADCMRILRHEAAHTIDNAYRLRRRKDWRQAFGTASTPYRSTYAPDPTSQDHVLNLDAWYSQSHPLEDWAETFAVWLDPRSDWRRRYAEWPALRKLETVDALMGEIHDKRPLLRTRSREESVNSVRMTLGEYYERKRQFYRDESTPAFDGQLKRVFPPHGRGQRAAGFLRKHRASLIRRVADSTGQHRYLVDHVLTEMRARCKSQDLRLASSPQEALVDSAILLTSLSSQFLYGAHPNYQR